MLKANFEAMQISLLENMAQMMRPGGAAPATAVQKPAAGTPPPPIGPSPQAAAGSASGPSTGTGAADPTASTYVGGGQKVARTEASASVTDGLVTTEAPPSFGGTTKLARDEEGDLNMD